MFFQLQAKDAVARINHYDALNCIQNLSWDSAMNAENLQQLGDANYDAQTVQPEVTGSFEARTTGALSSFLSRMIYKLNASTGEFEGYLAGATMTGLNTQLIRETDLQFAVFDLIEAKKANEVFDRSTLIPRAHLSQVSVSARVDGTATESFSFEADLLEVYRTPLHDLISIPVKRTTATPTVSVDLPSNAYRVEDASTIAGAVYKIRYLLVDNVKIDVASLVVTAGTGAVVDVVALSAGAQAAGLTIPLGARLALIVHRKTAGAFPVITYPTTARFVKADQTDIWLVDPATTYNVSANTRTVEAHLNAAVNLNTIPFADADLWLRLQSVDLSIPLQRQPLQELRKNDRGNSVYFRSAQYPLAITASIASLETDLNDWAKLQGKELYAADATPDILNLADFEGREWMIIVRYYKQGTTIQTIALLNARVDGRGAQVAVGGNAGVSWNFTGSKIAIQGAV
jgi:hypothetical protein